MRGKQPSQMTFSTVSPDSRVPAGHPIRAIKELADEGWTMVVVTHELAFARQAADEVLFMDGGVIVERGAPAQIFTNPREDRTRRFLDRILRPLD